MYEHQMRQRALVPVFQGTRREVAEFLVGLTQQRAMPHRTHKTR